MDFAAWQHHLVAGLGHEAAIPWDEPCRLEHGRQATLGRLSRRAGLLMDWGATWYDRLADGAQAPAEEAVLRVVARAYTRHAGSLRHLAEILKAPAGPLSIPAFWPLLPGIGRGEHLAVLHGAEVFARVWNQAIVDALSQDRLSSSVYATMLYERAFLLAYAREYLTTLKGEGALARLHVQTAHTLAVPVLLTGAWSLMGRDFQALTGWDWAASVRRCHHAYEQTYFGDLAYLRQRGLLTALTFLPL